MEKKKLINFEFDWAEIALVKEACSNSDDAVSKSILSKMMDNKFLLDSYTKEELMKIDCVLHASIQSIQYGLPFLAGVIADGEGDTK